MPPVTDNSPQPKGSPRSGYSPKNDNAGILDGAPIVDGFREGLDEFRMMMRPITYIKRRMGFVCGVCGVVALGSLTWWTFIQDPGYVTSADPTDPTEIARFTASRATRPVTNRIYNAFGWIGNQFGSTPQPQEAITPVQRLPNAYASNDDEQQ